jgi:S1-C subfamily serine protease
MNRRSFRRNALALAALSSAPYFALLPGAALALAPDQVFEKVSPSVWAIRGLDSTERPMSYGSGVVIGPGKVITNCHVLAKAKAIQVRRENVSYEGKLEHADAERDLCLISVAGFSAPAVEMGSIDNLKVGQRAYAIGNPQRFALTLSEGLISGLRGEDPRVPPIQTTAPISPGSSGGGLFDADAKLVGITTLIFVGRERLAQSINFALPADWIKEVPERAAAALAKRKEKAAVASAPGSKAPASSDLPAVGATWKYRFSDLRYGRVRHEFTLRVAGVDGWNVNETFERDGETSGRRTFQATVSAQELSFSERMLESGRTFVEFAPYLVATEKLEGTLPWRELGASFPATGKSWTYDGQKQSGEQVSVPAGSYKAIRIEINGNGPGNEWRTMVGMISRSRSVTRFAYTLWYAPEVKRYVKIHLETWDGTGDKSSDEIVELLEYKGG